MIGRWIMLATAMAVLPALPAPAAAQPVQAAAQNTRGNSFGGLDWGVGVSLTIDFPGLNRVKSAELVNDIVRVSHEEDARARIMLESHYFFPTQGKLFGVPGGSWGYGPFIAIQPGTDHFIEAFALGIMIGFKRGTGNQSFNIGLGIAVDPDTQVLGQGLQPNQPLPPGETAIRYRRESQYGLVILTSFSF